MTNLQKKAAAEKEAERGQKNDLNLGGKQTSGQANKDNLLVTSDSGFSSRPMSDAVLPNELPDTPDEAATMIQCIWRGYQTRHYNSRAVSVRNEIRVRRTEDHIIVVKAEVDRLRVLLEQEKQLRNLQFEAIGHLWKEVQSLQTWKSQVLNTLMIPGDTAPDGMRNGISDVQNTLEKINNIARGPDDGRNSEESAVTITGAGAEKQAELEVKCTGLQSQVQQLQEDLRNVSKIVQKSGYFSGTCTKSARGADSLHVTGSFEELKDLAETLQFESSAWGSVPHSLSPFQSDEEELYFSQVPHSGCPTPPRLTRVQHRGYNSLIVHWLSSQILDNMNRQTNKPLLGYRIYVNDEPKGLVAGTKTKALLEGLDVEITYKFYIKAVSALGESLQSNILMAAIAQCPHTLENIHLSSDDSSADSDHDRHLNSNKHRKKRDRPRSAGKTRKRSPRLDNDEHRTRSKSSDSESVHDKSSCSSRRISSDDPSLGILKHATLVHTHHTHTEPHPHHRSHSSDSPSRHQSRSSDSDPGSSVAHRSKMKPSSIDAKPPRGASIRGNLSETGSDVGGSPMNMSPKCGSKHDSSDGSAELRWSPQRRKRSDDLTQSFAARHRKEKSLQQEKPEIITGGELALDLSLLQCPDNSVKPIIDGRNRRSSGGRSVSPMLSEEDKTNTLLTTSQGERRRTPVIDLLEQRLAANKSTDPEMGTCSTYRLDSSMLENIPDVTPSVATTEGTQTAGEEASNPSPPKPANISPIERMKMSYGSEDNLIGAAAKALRFQDKPKSSSGFVSKLLHKLHTFSKTQEHSIQQSKKAINARSKLTDKDIKTRIRRISDSDPVVESGEEDDGIAHVTSDSSSGGSIRSDGNSTSSHVKGHRRSASLQNTDQEALSDIQSSGYSPVIKESGAKKKSSASVSGVRRHASFQGLLPSKSTNKQAQIGDDSVSISLTPATPSSSVKKSITNAASPKPSPTESIGHPTFRSRSRSPSPSTTRELYQPVLSAAQLQRLKTPPSGGGGHHTVSVSAVAEQQPQQLHF